MILANDRKWGLERDFESPSLLVLECRQAAGSHRGPAITEIDSPLLRGGRYLIDAPVSSRSTTVPLTSSNGNRAGSETGNFVRMRDSDHVSPKKLMPSGVRGVLT